MAQQATPKTPRSKKSNTKAQVTPQEVSGAPMYGSGLGEPGETKEVKRTLKSGAEISFKVNYN